jgi:hypothetical protein
VSVVQQKKEESIRVALQELDHPTSKMSAYEAMGMLHWAVCGDFDDDNDGSILGDW